MSELVENAYENSAVVSRIMESLRKRSFRPGQWSVTRLVCCPRKTYYYMSGKEPFIFDYNILTMARGRAHHGVLEVYPLREIEREKDGIVGDIDMVGERITEIFTTTVSLKKVKSAFDALKVFPLKVRQLMAYCYMCGEDEGDLLVFYLFGDYSRFVELFGKKVYTGIRPVLKCYTYKFKKSALEENWKEILRNKEEIEQALKDGVPPLKTGLKMECNYCPYVPYCFGEYIAERKKNEVL